MIRRAVKEDIPGIRKLLLQVLKVHNVGRPDLFKPYGWKYTEEQLAEIIACDDTPVFVSVDDEGNVLGHCFAIRQKHEESPATYAYTSLYIDDLCVDEEKRGQHVGKDLYEYVKDYAKNTGVYNITLHAWDKNPNAVRFYEHIGLGYQSYTMEEIL